MPQQWLKHVFQFDTDCCFFSQKMDKNKDGVVTLEEFVIACQEVYVVLHLHSTWHYKKLHEYILTTVNQME